MISLVCTMLPETIAYRNRVTADGGAVINLLDVDKAIRHAKANGYWSSVAFWTSAQFGVKKDGSNAVSKLYCLKGNDATQTTGANQPIWTANQQNGRAALVFDGSNDLITTGSSVITDDAIGIFVVFSGYPQLSTMVSQHAGTLDVGRLALAPGLYDPSVLEGAFDNDGALKRVTSTQVCFDGNTQLGTLIGNGSGSWTSQVYENIGTGTLSGQTLIPLNTPLRIGGSGSTGTFNGKFYSLMIINGLALSDNQISSIQIKTINDYALLIPSYPIAKSLFTAIDGTLLSSYTPELGGLWQGATGNMLISGNRLRVKEESNGGSYSNDRAYVDVGVSNYILKVRYTTNMAWGGESPYVMFRVIDKANHLIFINATYYNYMCMYKCTAGTKTIISPMPGMNDTGDDLLVLYVNGNNFRAFVNGVAVSASGITQGSTSVLVGVGISDGYGYQYYDTFEVYQIY